MGLGLQMGQRLEQRQTQRLSLRLALFCPACLRGGRDRDRNDGFLAQLRTFPEAPSVFREACRSMGICWHCGANIGPYSPEESERMYLRFRAEVARHTEARNPMPYVRIEDVGFTPMGTPADLFW